jgi:hypothetical protein
VVAYGDSGGTQGPWAKSTRMDISSSACLTGHTLPSWPPPDDDFALGRGSTELSG